jgi:hypothetical protein
MFSRLKKWVLAWFRDRTLDVYHPTERVIYRYFDGVKLVAADPMVLYKKYCDVCGDLSAAAAVARSPLKDARKAHTEMMELIRGIFDLPAPPADDPKDCSKSLSEVETEELLTHYLTWCHEVKKNSNPPPTSAGGTSPTTEFSSGDDPATSPSSASGSTTAAPSTDAATPSPTEPPSPAAT